MAPAGFKWVQTGRAGLVTLVFLISAVLPAQEPLRLPAFSGGYLDVPVDGYFEGYYDPSGEMDLAGAAAAPFVPLDSLGYPRGPIRHNDGRIWLRCRTDSLTRPPGDPAALFWHFNLRQTAVEGFRVTGNGAVHTFRWGRDSAGRALPTLFLLPFPAGPPAGATWYFRIRPFPYKIEDFRPSVMTTKGWRERSAARHARMRAPHNIMLGLTGITLFISFFLLVQWALYRARVFFLYGCFLLSGITNLYRYEMEFAVPVTALTAFLTTHGNQLSTYLGHMLYFLFVDEFLELRRRMPGLHRLMRRAAIFAGALVVVHFAVFYLVNRHDWALAMYYATRVLLLGIGFYSLYAVARGKPPFYQFIFWGGLSVAVGALIWMISGIRVERGLPGIPYANVYYYVGLMIETLFFLSGMGYKFRINEIDKRRAQQKLLDERERLTRDLHDDVGSTLNSLAVMSELAQRQSDRLPAEVADTLTMIQLTARDTVQRIGDIIWSVNPNIETVGDLVARMRNFTFSLFSGTATRVRFSVPDQLESLPIPPDRRWQLYLIFKEAINNVRKYAGATLVRIVLESREGRLYLSVHDNGQGFDPAHAPAGNGLRTMQERGRAIGATVRVQAAPGEGTEIEVECLSA